jgi:VanZ family protein
VAGVNSAHESARAALDAVRHPQRPAWRRLWAAALGAGVALATWLMLRQGSGLPAAWPGLDKLGHLLTFAALSVPTALLLVRRPGRAWRVLVLGLAYGGAIEIVQSFLPWRSAEWLDLAADGAGVLLGLALLRLVEAAVGAPPAGRR